MSDKTYKLLLENNEKYISINGSAQIRAGVLRPDVFIHNDKEPDQSFEDSQNDLIISINSKVRIIR